MKKNLNLFNLNPEWISGFTQADGSFSITINKRKNNIWLVPKFNLVQHNNNDNIIIAIKEQFGVGFYKYYNNDKTIRYQVNVLKELHEVIIPFFIKYPLRGNKYISFLKFKYIIDKMYHKEHYDKNVLLKLINIAYNMNPLSRRKESKLELLRYFNEANRNLIKKDINYHDLDLQISNFQLSKLSLYFICGLFDGDGCLTVWFNKQNRIIIEFSIVQDIYNKNLLVEIKDFFKCGNIYKLSEKAFIYRNSNLKEIKEIILPLLLKGTAYIKNNKVIYTKQIIELITITPEYNKNKDLIIKILELLYNIIKNPQNINRKNYIHNKLTDLGF